jgi:hypothetical protein
MTATPCETTDLVKRYRDAWLEWSRRPDFPLAPDHCINGTRIAVDVLTELGVRCRPVSVDVRVYNRFAVELYTAGVPIRQWPVHAHSIGTDLDNERSGQWGGHLIVEGDGWLLDVSARQFHRPGLVEVDRPLMIEGMLPRRGNAVFTDCHGQAWVIRRTPTNDGWRRAPGWRRRGVNREAAATMLERVR